MAASDEDLTRRLFNAQESFDTELKPWIDPTNDVGKAVIAKACMALYNVDGGFLIIGIADDGSCLNDRIPPSVRKRYHVDVIHEIVTKFSSNAFQIQVHFVERDGHPRVIIEVPSGVKTPVFCRNDLPKKDMSRNKAGSLLRVSDIYVRTLLANGRVSSARAGAPDWTRMMEICFNNREADIGAFARRQLSGLDTAKLIEAIQTVLATVTPLKPTERLNAYMDEMYLRFVKSRDEHKSRPPQTGTRESAAIILGDFLHPELSREYMMRFLQVPRYSGWPPWFDLMNADSALGHLTYDSRGLESFEYVTQMFPSLDFSRMDASGAFYYVEALRDDMQKQVAPGKYLEFVIETARVTEIFAVCLAFAKEFCGADSSNDLAFAFRWRGLRGRQLSTWANPARMLRSRDVAEQDEIVTYATMPVAMPSSAIGLHVEGVVKSLFRLFGGRQFESRTIQEIVSGRLGNEL
jgi:hypothetical protein